MINAIWLIQDSYCVCLLMNSPIALFRSVANCKTVMICPVLSMRIQTFCKCTCQQKLDTGNHKNDMAANKTVHN